MTNSNLSNRIIQLLSHFEGSFFQAKIKLSESVSTLLKIKLTIFSVEEHRGGKSRVESEPKTENEE